MLPERIKKEFVQKALISSINEAIEYFKEKGYDISRDKALELIQRSFIEMFYKEKEGIGEYGRKKAYYKVIKRLGNKDKDGNELCIEAIRNGNKLTINMIKCPDYILRTEPIEKPIVSTEESLEKSKQIQHRLDTIDKLYMAFKRHDTDTILSIMQSDFEIFQYVIKKVINQ